jgi:hypothetical protein
MAQLGGLFLMMLCFPFGGNPCPAQWCSISYPICDLANDLIHDPTCDQSDMMACYLDGLPIPDRSGMVRTFAKANDMVFNVPNNPIVAAYCYIDDLCTMCVDLELNAKGCTAAVALVLDVVDRPLDPYDPLMWDALLSIEKLQGEVDDLH